MQRSLGVSPEAGADVPAWNPDVGPDPGTDAPEWNPDVSPDPGADDPDSDCAIRKNHGPSGEECMWVVCSIL